MDIKQDLDPACLQLHCTFCFQDSSLVVTVQMKAVFHLTNYHVSTKRTQDNYSGLNIRTIQAKTTRLSASLGELQAGYYYHYYYYYY
jgi:hypothetical protein